MVISKSHHIICKDTAILMTLNSFQGALNTIDFQLWQQKTFYRSQKILVSTHHLIDFKELKTKS